MTIKKVILIVPIIIGALFISSCCSSKGNLKDENSIRNSKIPQNIPPGTADVKAEIINFVEEKDNFICRIKIHEVFEYGASIRPLPSGTEIDCYISKYLLEKEPRDFKEEEIILARVSQVNTPGDKNYYEIIMFNK